MEKNKIARIIFFILTIATAIIIFMFSNENKEQSGNTSKNFIEGIIEIFPKTKKLEQEEKEEIIKKAQPLIRKLAHFSIYTVLGINVMGYIITYKNIEQKQQIILAIITCIIYATSDEIHQYFSSRGPSILDVGIDTCGSMLGLCITKGTNKLTTKK